MKALSVYLVLFVALAFPSVNATPWESERRYAPIKRSELPAELGKRCAPCGSDDYCCAPGSYCVFDPDLGYRACENVRESAKDVPKLESERRTAPVKRSELPAGLAERCAPCPEDCCPTGSHCVLGPDGVACEDVRESARDISKVANERNARPANAVKRSELTAELAERCQLCGDTPYCCPPGTRCLYSYDQGYSACCESYDTCFPHSKRR